MNSKIISLVYSVIYLVIGLFMGYWFCNKQPLKEREILSLNLEEMKNPQFSEGYDLSGNPLGWPEKERSNNTLAFLDRSGFVQIKARALVYKDAECLREVLKFYKAYCVKDKDWLYLQILLYLENGISLKDCANNLRLAEKSSKDGFDKLEDSLTRFRELARNINPVKTLMPPERKGQ